MTIQYVILPLTAIPVLANVPTIAVVDALTVMPTLMVVGALTVIPTLALLLCSRSCLPLWSLAP